jgi:hypothetical protein
MFIVLVGKSLLLLYFTIHNEVIFFIVIYIWKLLKNNLRILVCMN